MAVGDTGEQRDDFLIAFKRMDIDGATAAGEARQAGVTDEILDAGVRKHVG